MFCLIIFYVHTFRAYIEPDKYTSLVIPKLKCCRNTTTIVTSTIAQPRTQIHIGDEYYKALGPLSVLYCTTTH